MLQSPLNFSFHFINRCKSMCFRFHSGLQIYTPSLLLWLAPSQSLGTSCRDNGVNSSPPPTPPAPSFSSPSSLCPAVLPKAQVAQHSFPSNLQTLLSDIQILQLSGPSCLSCLTSCSHIKSSINCRQDSLWDLLFC